MTILASILNFILGNKQLLILMILVSIIVITMLYIRHIKAEIVSLTNEKATVVAKLEVSQASVKELQASIETQNKAIDQLKIDADKRVDSHKAEIDTAKHISDNYKQQAKDLMKRLSAANMTKCDAANQLINEELFK